MKEKIIKLIKGSGIKYIVSSVVSVLADNLFYFLLLTIFGLKNKEIMQILSTFISSVINFNLNKFWVFEKKGNYIKECLGYYCIFFPRTAVSVLATSVLQNTFTTLTPIFATGIKMIVDLILFIIVYFLQKKLIFKK